jgi:hypothetical protein
MGVPNGEGCPTASRFYILFFLLFLRRGTGMAPEKII